MNISKTAFFSIVLVLLLVIFAIRSLPKDEEQSAENTSQIPSVVPSIANESVLTSPTLAVMEKLDIKDTLLGTGAVAKAGSIVKVNYTGKLTNGEVFDTSLKAGRTPIEFTLGQGEVIEGWDKGLLEMKVGGKRTLTIPPSLGYGDRPAGSIPPGSTLIFDVELMEVK